MKNKFFVSILAFCMLLIFSNIANAQMMGWNFNNNEQPSQSALSNEQNEQNEGQDIFLKLQNKQITCSQLKDEDFDKLGDYFMWKSLGKNTKSHYYMDQQMTQMMGDEGNTQMHIILGKRGSGCTNQTIPSSAPSYLMPMMNYDYFNSSDNGSNPGSNYNMMWGYGANIGWGFGIIEFLVWLITLAVLILLGIWLWKQIQKK